MDPKTILRLEGVGLFAAATAAYFTLGGPVWLFLLLALAPDVSMLGYRAGPVVGSRLYNAFHTTVGPVALGAAGVLLGVTPLVWVALVWGAHIGADRAVGYGLKYPTGFTDTHLGSGTARTDSTVELLGDTTEQIASETTERTQRAELFDDEAGRV
ncbi:DUF4260 domain-containing protein [Halobellus ordinarius]|uniref:DUF4260 domain-containing protein n=1 Tax=Halobellus ordinarius TaxID=3075120 RepID=UPI0028800217|nr:DUF4260 domain-containing protein [Halobellus sp. ZY16]